MKSERIVVSTEAGRGLRLRHITSKFGFIVTPLGEQIMFWEGMPYAIYDQHYIYLLEGTVRGALAAVRKHCGPTPTLIQPINDFEYAIGQALSKAGLMLVRRLDS
jgi:hypothetical protein